MKDFPKKCSGRDPKEGVLAKNGIASNSIFFTPKTLSLGSRVLAIFSENLSLSPFETFLNCKSNFIQWIFRFVVFYVLLGAVRLPASRISLSFSFGKTFFSSQSFSIGIFLFKASFMSSAVLA